MKKKYTLVISDVELNVVTEAPWELVEKIVGILDRKMRDINLKSYRCTKNQAALLCALEYCSEKLELQERNAELEELADQDAATIEQKDQRIAELEAELARVQGENEIMHNILERAAASTKRMMGHHEPAPAAAAPAEQVAEQVAEQQAELEAEAPAAEADKVEEVPAEAAAEVPAEAPAQEPAAQAEEEIAAEQNPAEDAQAAEQDTAAADAAEKKATDDPDDGAPQQLTVDFSETEEQPEVNTKAAQVIEEIAESQSDVPRARAKAKKTKSRSRVGSMFDLLTFNDV